MSWKRVGDDIRQHTYGVPMAHVAVESPRTVGRLVAAGWRVVGLCAGDESGAWFSHKGSHAERRAKVVCSMCPVRDTCLGSALLHGEEFGVWGGLDPDDRRPLDEALKAGISLEAVLDDAHRVRHVAS